MDGGNNRKHDDKKLLNISLFYLIITVVIVLVVLGGGYKFVSHESKQNIRIDELNAQITLLQEKIESMNNTIEWNEEGFNYLAIGNSITWHKINDYWWSEDGMAASTANRDYFHQVKAYLEENFNAVTAYAYNGAAWEVQANDRSEVLDLWNRYLSEELDLVTIQLSENVNEKATFENDFREMVEYVQEKCPNAQIIVIDDFWSDEKSKLKKNAISRLNVDFMDLNGIRGKNEYQAGIGTKVYDADGGEHIVEHSGVAKHPGDKGMDYYADALIKHIQKYEY